MVSMVFSKGRTALRFTLFLAAATCRAEEPTSVTGMFQHPSFPAPALLEASVITSYHIKPSRGISPDFVVTYEAAC